MARTDNFFNFATDVANAIKTKSGNPADIPISGFDTAIEAIPTGGGGDTAAFTWIPTDYTLTDDILTFNYNKQNEYNKASVYRLALSGGEVGQIDMFFLIGAGTYGDSESGSTYIKVTSPTLSLTGKLGIVTTIGYSSDIITMDFSEHSSYYTTIDSFSRLEIGFGGVPV